MKNHRKQDNVLALKSLLVYMKGLQNKDTMEKKKCIYLERGELCISGFKNYTMSEQQKILDTINFSDFQKYL